MLSYRAILKKAWSISWRHKILWFFGLFAALSMAGGSLEGQIIFQNFNRNLVDSAYLQTQGFVGFIEALKSICLGFGALFRENFLTIINGLTTILTMGCVAVVLIWLTISSQGGLIDGIKKLLQGGKKTPEISIRAGLTVGHQRFWSIFGLNFLIKLLISVAFFIISLPLFMLEFSSSAAWLWLYIILFLIFMPTAVALSLMLKYAIAFRVVEDKTFVASFSHGWKLFKKNWLVSVEMAVILFALNFLVGIAALLIISFIFYPLFLVGILFKFYAFMVLVVFLALVFLVLLGSLMTTFQTASWTALFLELRNKGFAAKLERLFRK